MKVSVLILLKSSLQEEMLL